METTNKYALFSVNRDGVEKYICDIVGTRAHSCTQVYNIIHLFDIVTHQKTDHKNGCDDFETLKHGTFTLVKQ